METGLEAAEQVLAAMLVYGEKRAALVAAKTATHEVWARAHREMEESKEAMHRLICAYLDEREAR
jgi:hypothetical protein